MSVAMNRVAVNTERGLSKRSISSPRSMVSTGVLVDPRAFLHEYASIARGTTRVQTTNSPRRAVVTHREPGSSRQSFAGVVALLVLIVAGLLVSQVARANEAPTRSPIVTAHRMVSVQPGDSLWSIARAIQPSGDVRPLVDAMIAERGSSVLRVGDTVMVPLSWP